MQILTNTKSRYFINFENQFDFLQSIDNMPVVFQDSDSLYGKFSQCFSEQEYHKLLTCGFSEALTAFHATNEQCNNMAAAKRKATIYGIQGNFPCVPRAIAGHPASMISRRIIEKDNPIVNIYVDIACSGATETDDIIKGGQWIIRQIRQIEAAGKEVNLYVGDCLEQERQKVISAICIKRAGESLNLAALSFWVGHPAALRIAMFQLYRRMHLNYHDYGYGRVWHDSEAKERAFREWFHIDDVILYEMPKAIIEEKRRLRKERGGR